MPYRIGTTDPSLTPSLNGTFRSSPLQYVRTAYIRFLQGLFWYQTPGTYHWEPGEDTEIWITDETPIRTDVVGVRPAIAITRAPVTMIGLGMDDMLELDLKTGRKTKSVLMPGTIAINCCSRASQESENIASFVAENMWMLRDSLQKQKFYEIGRNLAIGSPSPAGSIVTGDGGDEWTCTTVTSPFQINRTGTVTPLGQQISGNISIALGLGVEDNTQPEIPQYPTYPIPAYGTGIAYGDRVTTPDSLNLGVEVHQDGSQFVSVGGKRTRIRQSIKIR